LMSNMLYQLPSDEARTRAIARARQYVDPDEGVLIVQDYLKPAAGGLRFIDDWYKRDFQFRIMVFNPRSGDRAFKEFLVAKDGSCNVMRLGKDFAEIIGASNYYDLVAFKPSSRAEH
jgi:hypothetical protein